MTSGSIVSSTVGGRIGAKAGRSISTGVYSRKFSRDVLKNPPRDLEKGFYVKPGIKNITFYLLGLTLVLALTGIFIFFIYFSIIFSFTEQVLQNNNWGNYLILFIFGVVLAYFTVAFIAGLVPAIKYLLTLPKIKVYKNGFLVKKLFSNANFVPWENIISVKFEDKTKIFDATRKSFLIEITYLDSGSNNKDDKGRSVSRVLLYEFNQNLMWLLGAIVYFKPELEGAVADILKYYHLAKPSESRKIVNIAKNLQEVFEELPEFSEFNG